MAELTLHKPTGLSSGHGVGRERCHLEVPLRPLGDLAPWPQLETNTQHTFEDPVDRDRLVSVQRAPASLQAEAQPCGCLLQSHCADWGLGCWETKGLVRNAQLCAPSGSHCGSADDDGASPRPHGLPCWENLPASVETLLAAESLEELRSGVASGAGLLVTITACLGSRAWRRMARASLCVVPLRDLPLMERTSLPF